MLKAYLEKQQETVIVNQVGSRQGTGVIHLEIWSVLTLEKSRKLPSRAWVGERKRKPSKKYPLSEQLLFFLATVGLFLLNF